MKHLASLLFLAGTLAFAQAPAKKPAPAPAKPEPAKVAPKPEAKPAAGGFVGNKDSKVFHKADCGTAAKMKAENRVALASKAEAEKGGYKACKLCKP